MWLEKWSIRGKNAVMSSAALMPSKSFPVFNGCVSREKPEREKKKKERSRNVTSDSHALRNDRRVLPLSPSTGMCVRDKCISAALQSAEIQHCYVTSSQLPLWFENTNIMRPRTQMTSAATANG